jgi:hypothetical protein
MLSLGVCLGGSFDGSTSRDSFRSGILNVWYYIGTRYGKRHEEHV